MRKVFLLFVATSLMFTSCSDDDSTKQDQLIGKWGYIQEFENNIESQLDECDLKDTITFDADGTLKGEFYEDSLGNGSCTLITQNGTWSNEGNNNYRITIGDDSEVTKVTFEGDTFSFTQQDGDITYKSVYKRK